MPVITWEVFDGATPSWTDLGSDRLVFSGSLSSITATVAATQFQDGTHAGTGTPGTDACGAHHVPNTKLIDSTHVSLNGAGSVVLNDTNVIDTACSFRLHFNDGAAYEVQNARLYSFDGVTITNRAVGVDLASYVKYQSQAQWFTLNSDTIVGPAVSGMSFTTASIGGNNTSMFQTLADQLSGSVDHFWYVAISASPEVGGGKSYALGAYIEFF